MADALTSIVRHFHSFLKLKVAATRNPARQTLLPTASMLPVNLLQLTDARALVGNAVGAACFVAAYGASMAISRRESEIPGRNAASLPGPPLGMSAADVDAFPTSSNAHTEALWIRRCIITRDLRNRGETVSDPPRRLLAQELQGDMPLYYDARAGTWVWLEPFKLEPTMQETLDRRTSTSPSDTKLAHPPAFQDIGRICWDRVPRTSIFRRGDEEGSASLSKTVVELPCGKYYALLGTLPFYGLGPSSKYSTVLTRDGWTPDGAGSETSTPATPCSGAATADRDVRTPNSKARDAAVAAFPTPPDSTLGKRKANCGPESEETPSKRLRGDPDPTSPSPLPVPVTPDQTALPRARSPPGAPRANKVHSARAARASGSRGIVPLQETWSTDTIFPNSPRQDI